MSVVRLALGPKASRLQNLPTLMLAWNQMSQLMWRGMEPSCDVGRRSGGGSQAAVAAGGRATRRRWGAKMCGVTVHKAVSIGPPGS